MKAQELPMTSLVEGRDFVAAGPNAGITAAGMARLLDKSWTASLLASRGRITIKRVMIITDNLYHVEPSAKGGS